jgi:hypothetical protein
VRMTAVLVREDGRWRVAQSHALYRSKTRHTLPDQRFAESFTRLCSTR